MPFEGLDLLAKVKELGDAPKSELVRSCGYFSTKKDGTERLNFTAFYEALLNAKGVSLGEHTGEKGKAGRIPVSKSCKQEESLTEKTTKDHEKRSKSQESTQSCAN